MMFQNLKRILNAGLISFWRNSFVSLASVFVMTMTLMIIGSLMFLNGVTSQFVEYVKGKVDVNVYFAPDADGAAVADVVNAVKVLPEVASVTFTSRDDALANFRARHEGDQLTLQALDELGDNPFGATLAIKAKQPSQYVGVAAFLDDYTNDASGKAVIDSVNYAANKTVIDQLDRVTGFATRFAYAVIILFALASILITFNTIRLAIYTAKDEIGVMRLVGASNAYVRGPFIVEGTLYGAISGLLALILFVPVTLFFRGAVKAAFNADIFSLYLGDIWLFALILIGAGALLGAVSSFLAVRKYLQI
jgi:cell division transport system permease protein